MQDCGIITIFCDKCKEHRAVVLNKQIYIEDNKLICWKCGNKLILKHNSHRLSNSEQAVIE